MDTTLINLLKVQFFPLYYKVNIDIILNQIVILIFLSDFEIWSNDNRSDFLGVLYICNPRYLTSCAQTIKRIEVAMASGNVTNNAIKVPSSKRVNTYKMCFLWKRLFTIFYLFRSFSITASSFTFRSSCISILTRS